MDGFMNRAYLLPSQQQVIHLPNSGVDIKVGSFDHGQMNINTATLPSPFRLPPQIDSANKPCYTGQMVERQDLLRGLVPTIIYIKEKDGTERYQCKICGAIFNHHFDIYVHMRVHDRDQGLQTSLHGGVVSNDSSIKGSVGILPDKPYECLICSTTFTSSKDLLRHVMAFHSSDPDSPVAKVPQELLPRNWPMVPPSNYLQQNKLLDNTHIPPSLLPPQEPPPNVALIRPDNDLRSADYTSYIWVPLTNSDCAKVMPELQNQSTASLNPHATNSFAPLLQQPMLLTFSQPPSQPRPSRPPRPPRPPMRKILPAPRPELQRQPLLPKPHLYLQPLGKPLPQLQVPPCPQARPHQPERDMSPPKQLQRSDQSQVQTPSIRSSPFPHQSTSPSLQKTVSQSTTADSSGVGNGQDETESNGRSVDDNETVPLDLSCGIRKLNSNTLPMPQDQDHFFHEERNSDNNSQHAEETISSCSPPSQESSPLMPENTLNLPPVQVPSSLADKLQESTLHIKSNSDVDSTDVQVESRGDNLQHAANETSHAIDNVNREKPVTTRKQELNKHTRGCGETSDYDVYEFRDDSPQSVECLEETISIPSKQEAPPLSQPPQDPLQLSPQQAVDLSLPSVIQDSARHLQQRYDDKFGVENSKSKSEEESENSTKKLPEMNALLNLYRKVVGESSEGDTSLQPSDDRASDSGMPTELKEESSVERDKNDRDIYSPGSLSPLLQTQHLKQQHKLDQEQERPRMLLKELLLHGENIEHTAYGVPSDDESFRDPSNITQDRRLSSNSFPLIDQQELRAHFEIELHFAELQLKRKYSALGLRSNLMQRKRRPQTLSMQEFDSKQSDSNDFDKARPVPDQSILPQANDNDFEVSSYVGEYDPNVDSEVASCTPRILRTYSLRSSSSGDGSQSPS